MVLMKVLILGLLAWLILTVVVRFTRGPLVRYCRACGYSGPTRSVVSGHILIEIVLWCALIVPGLIYSIWRVTSRHLVCTSCGSSNVIPPETPVARLGTAEFATELTEEATTCPFCAETIKKAARVCKHCGRDLPLSGAAIDPLLSAKPEK